MKNKLLIKQCQLINIADQLYLFYKKFHSSQNHQFLPFSQAFFKECLASKGAACFILWQGKIICGYSIAITLTTEEDAILEILQPIKSNIDQNFLSEQVLFLCGALLDKSVINQGFHKSMLAHRMDFAKCNNKLYVFATVSPRNSRSLNNLLRANFYLYKVIVLHGVYVRFLMYKILPILLDRSGCVKKHQTTI